MFKENIGLSLPFFGVLAVVIHVSCQANITVDDGTNGSAVVLLAVARIQQSGVFKSDNNLLRRIAYVQTQDGNAADTFREGYFGGIWAVSEAVFEHTQNLSSDSRLPAKLQEVNNQLNISWQEAQWRDLLNPLYSALAARLVLYLAGTDIPPTNDLQAQAIFWYQHYNPNGDLTEFVSQSRKLEGEYRIKLEQNPKLDISLVCMYIRN